MTIIGVDAHKRTHTLVAVDETGRRLAEKTVAATPEGHLEAVAWARAWPEHTFALEDCRHLTRRLEIDLLRAGEAVVRVPPHRMAAAREGGRQRGKSDSIDALAVARAALREPGLPVVRLEGEAREVRLLVDHREDLVGERSRLQSRLRWHLHELFPGLEIAPKALRRLCVLDELAERLAGVEGTVAAIARDLLARCREMTLRINELERQIARIVDRLAPSLVALPGCGALSAAKIVGETAGSDALPLAGRLRPLERHRAHPGVVGEQRPSPPDPRREPPDQRRPAPHRGHAVPRRGRPRTRVRPAPHGRGRQQDRGAAPSASPSLGRGLPPSRSR